MEYAKLQSRQVSDTTANARPRSPQGSETLAKATPQSRPVSAFTANAKQLFKQVWNTDKGARSDTGEDVKPQALQGPPSKALALQVAVCVQVNRH